MTGYAARRWRLEIKGHHNWDRVESDVMARAIDRCDLMIKVLRVPGVQGNRLQDLQPNRSCETTHNMVFHLCYRVTFIRSKIFFKWIRTHYSPFSGEVCAGSDCRRNARCARFIPYITVSLGLLGFWGHSWSTPTQPPERNNPEHLKHSGLAMNYLTEICWLLSS